MIGSLGATPHIQSSRSAIGAPRAIPYARFSPNEAELVRMRHAMFSHITITIMFKSAYGMYSRKQIAGELTRAGI